MRVVLSQFRPSLHILWQQAAESPRGSSRERPALPQLREEVHLGAHGLPDKRHKSQRFSADALAV